MKVKRSTLLLLACLVWSAAGFNILRIGLTAYPPYRSVLNFLLSILVFTVFQKFIFGKLVKKHTARIHSYVEERHFFLTMRLWASCDPSRKKSCYTKV